MANKGRLTSSLPGIGVTFCGSLSLRGVNWRRELKHLKSFLSY